MLGLGWTEMLVIGVVALIFIGPKDLPVVMGRIGKVIGQVQRLGREFQREINKTTGLDEVRNLRTSITSPLKKTADEIRKDFNAIGKDGKEQPTGALKPTDPNTESVVEAIQQQAGMAPARKSNDELAADYGFKTTEAPKAEPARTEPVKAARATPKAATPAAEPAPAKPKAAKPKTAPAKTTAATEPAKAEAAKPAAKAVRKPATPKAAKPSDEAASKPAAKPRAPRKKPAETAGKSE
jgi:sec-independent protein translocase protein TatB